MKFELMRFIMIIHSKADAPKLIANLKASGERHGVEDSDFPMDDNEKIRLWTLNIS